MRYVREAAAGGADAKAELANIHRGTVLAFVGLVTPDPVEAFCLMQDAVARGSMSALNDLALAYFAGDGVGRDYGSALTYFRSSADANNRKAYRHLGLTGRRS